MNNVPYASARESLMHAMLCTLPNICFAVGLLSRYQSNLELTHWQAIKRIIHCLHGTANLVLCYQGEGLKLRGYSDADWGDDLNESRPFSRYVSTQDGGAILWCSDECLLEA